MRIGTAEDAPFLVDAKLSRVRRSNSAPLGLHTWLAQRNVPPDTGVTPTSDRPMSSADRPTLRASMRAARRALPARARLAAAEAVAERLRAHIQAFSEPKVIAGYWACDGELPLHLLLAGRPAFTYLLPRVRAERCIDFVPWRPGDAVVANRFGIPEPEAGVAVELTAIDVILLPLLAFNRDGSRLGSGGGYYDRSLASLAGAAPGNRPQLIGVGYALQEAATLHTEAWDVGLHNVVTEVEWIDCREHHGASTSL